MLHSFEVGGEACLSLCNSVVIYPLTCDHVSCSHHFSLFKAQTHTLSLFSFLSFPSLFVYLRGLFKKKQQQQHVAEVD